jgi:hypothetical protein
MKLLIFPLAICLLLTASSCDKNKNETTQPTLGNLSFNKVWGKAYGGINRESSTSIVGTSDGGYVLYGRTESNDRDVSGLNGHVDAWVLKVDAAGNTVWQRTIGGTSEDLSTSILQNTDGSFVGVGFGKSNDGDISGNRGGSDAFIFKLDKNGNRLWIKTYGGTGDDLTMAMVADGKGNYVVTGISFTGDSNTSDGQGWVFKIDGNGNLLWEKKYGGSQRDYFRAVNANLDGSFMLAGNTGSSDGDVTGYKGGPNDIWVMKIDGNGNKLWQKTLGGSGHEAAFGLVTTKDGGHLIVGSGNNNDGDLVGGHGGVDGFVMKLDGQGNKQWSKLIGGTGWETAPAIIPSKDGGYLIGAYTLSTDGDFATSLGRQDAWILKIDENGKDLGKQIIGGSDNDQIEAMAMGTDGSYVVAGFSNSQDGDVTGYQGHIVSDAWILKFKDQR